MNIQALWRFQFPVLLASFLLGCGHLEDTDGPHPELSNASSVSALAHSKLPNARLNNSTEKVTLCHTPPGNPTEAHTITVGQASAAAHLAHGDTLGPCELDQSPRIAGAVYDRNIGQPVSQAFVTVEFPFSGLTETMYTDVNGLFSFNNIQGEDIFIITAIDQLTLASGSYQGFFNPGEQVDNVLVLVDDPGPGTLSGTVFSAGGIPSPNSVVTYMFPETKRMGVTTTNEHGQYTFTSLAVDGTVIVIAFAPEHLTSASYSTMMTPGRPNATVNFTLPPLGEIQPELMNGSFSDGLQSWATVGPTVVTPREDFFGSQTAFNSEHPMPSEGSLIGAGDQLDPRINDNGCPVVKAAVISTAGSSNGLGQLSQTFTVPPGYGQLVGRVKFLSNEWPEYYGSEFNDTFLVRMTTVSGVQILSSGNLNSSTWSGGAPGFNGQTPEVNFAVDVSKFVGQPVTLHFEVRDVGDLLYDSGLAIGDIKVMRTEQYLPAGGGILSGPGSISGQFGQGVKITFKNLNVLGTTITVEDKTPFGETQGIILLPQTSHTFTYGRFGEEPMYWEFDVSTVSDAFLVSYSIESTWVPGMPPNPCF